MPSRQELLTRRQFIGGAAVVGAGFLTGAAFRQAEAAVYSDTEKPQLLKKIEIPSLPDLSVEVYSAKYTDITDEVRGDFRESLAEWVNTPEFDKDGVHKAAPDQNGNFRSDIVQMVWKRERTVLQTGMQYASIGFLRDRAEAFYFNGKTERFYSGLAGKSGYSLLPEDLEILGLQDGDIYLEYLSRDGKVLVVAGEVSGINFLTKATVIMDIPAGTKTFIRSRSEDQYVHGVLSDSGNRLLLTCTDYATGSCRGVVDLVDLGKWQVSFHLDEVCSLWNFLNEDGDLLYMEEMRGQQFEGSCFYDTESGVWEPVMWYTGLSSSGIDVVSRNILFLGRTYGMFSAGKYVEGQWGMEIRTPDGFFFISSKEKSLVPRVISNDGSVNTTRGDVFRYDGETFRLTRTGVGGSFTPKIEKILQFSSICVS